MPASPSELVKSLHSTLSATLEHVDTLDGYEEKSKAAKAQLTATAQELSTTSKKLEAVKAELAAAESKLQSKEHLIHDEEARTLQSLNKQIAEKQGLVRQLDSELKTRREEYDNVVAGMRSLQQRINV